jgi:hypothetical protein
VKRRGRRGAHQRSSHRKADVPPQLPVTYEPRGARGRIAEDAEERTAVVAPQADVPPQLRVTYENSRSTRVKRRGRRGAHQRSSRPRFARADRMRDPNTSRCLNAWRFVFGSLVRSGWPPEAAGATTPVRALGDSSGLSEVVRLRALGGSSAASAMSFVPAPSAVRLRPQRCLSPPRPQRFVGGLSEVFASAASAIRRRPQRGLSSPRPQRFVCGLSEVFRLRGLGGSSAASAMSFVSAASAIRRRPQRCLSSLRSQRRISLVGSRSG